MQKISILGSGAMGCLIGGLIQRAGHDVTFIARGKQLEALRTHGLTLDTEGDHWHGDVTATDSSEQAGKQDVVILCTKAYQLPQIVNALQPMLHDETILVPAVNGLPWWYFHNHGGPFDGRHLDILDPTGALKNIDPARIVGCVNYLAGTLTRPGHVQYVPELKRRIALGELDGTISPRLETLGRIFTDAGFEPQITPTIRQTVWHKLWGNIAFNPIGALTHGTIDQLAEGYNDVDLLSAVMNEARFIADKLGIELGQTIKSRIEAAAKMRGHRTSMQQDIEAHRETEIDAIVGAVREIAKWMEVDTPYLNTLYSLVKLKDRFARYTGDGQA